MVDGAPQFGHDTLQSQHPPVGHVIMDTGCRTAVMQMKVKKLGLKYYSVEHEEVFRFGAGSPVLSTRAYVYPVTIYKEKSWVNRGGSQQKTAELRNAPVSSDLQSWPGGKCRWTSPVTRSALEVTGSQR